MTDIRKTITILIPTYNEESSILPLYLRLRELASSESSYDFVFLFVNDGSSDETGLRLREIAEDDSRVEILELSRNFGKEIAVVAGLDYSSGDALVILDADLQHPPELIPKMIRLWEDGNKDVFARRNARAGESWFKRFGTGWYYRMLKRAANVEVYADAGDFRLLDKECVHALRSLREHERNNKALYAWIGFQKAELTYDVEDRKAGVSTWNYFKLFELAINGLTSFTAFPLRISAMLGFIASLAAAVYLIYLVVTTLLFGTDMSGFPTIVSLILFFGGVQLLSLGIIGEYLGKVFFEVKERPLYLVSDFHKQRDIAPEED